MKTILITGGMGLIGQSLTQMLLDKGYSVIIASRNPPASSSIKNLSYISWNTTRQWIDPEAIKKADAIINLAGAGVADKRWSESRKKEIAESRVMSGQTIVKALKEIPNKVEVVIQSSAIGWDGPVPEHNSSFTGFTEAMPAYNDFLGQTCKQWENSIIALKVMGVRVAIVRTGIVLTNKGGALKEFRKPLNFRLATILGKGTQKVSWIHIKDLCREMLFLLENESCAGIYNGVAPTPVTNKELILTLAKQLYGSSFLTVTVPSFVLKVVMGEMSIEVLKSTTVKADKIRAAGFKFEYETVEDAVKYV